MTLLFVSFPLYALRPQFSNLFPGRWGGADADVDVCERALCESNVTQLQCFWLIRRQICGDLASMFKAERGLLGLTREATPAQPSYVFAVTTSRLATCIRPCTCTGIISLYEIAIHAFGRDESFLSQFFAAHFSYHLPTTPIGRCR